MGQEITRASSADRDRYANHIPELYAQGLISEAQMYHMLDMVLKAQTLVQLDDLLDGLPRPAGPPQPRDYAVPRNFLQACAAWSLFGLTVAVVPPLGLLDGSHGAVASVFAGLLMLWGIWITIVAIITVFVKFDAWDNLGEREKEERRRKDQQGR